MGWMQELCNTYEKASDFVGKEDDTGTILLPIAHSTQNAQIEVTIDVKGEFCDARILGKGEGVTIIPVTEDSGSRSSGITPHPLFDKLCYIAGDYTDFCDGKTQEFFDAYIKQLDDWYLFGCHPYIEAVYHYLKMKTLIEDLVKTGILVLNVENKIDDSVKVGNVAQSEAFVRFRIRTDPKVGSGIGEIWKESEVYDDYIRYYLTKITKTDLDYITGKQIPCSDKQPSKIRNSADKAKLISANDTSGFTYRGRFTGREEALSLGYIPSQKAHNALKWLIERQGYRRNDRAIVVWNPEMKEVPNWWEDTYGYFKEETETDFSASYAYKVREAIKGKYCDLDNKNADIVVMVMDAATPGRLSITYYRKIMGSTFLQKLIDWHTSCIWSMRYRRDKNGKPVVMAPTVEDIVKIAYGHEQNEKLSVDDKLKNITIERLFPCIIDGKKIPEDIMCAAVERANNPLAYNTRNRNKIMDITCALLNKKYGKDKGENIMALDRNSEDIDYLYGRLLAVAHKMEYDTYTDEEKGKRDTNADRYRNRMVQNPNRTWMLIYGRLLDSYRKKLSVKAQTFYQKEIQQICDLMNPKVVSEKGRLNEQYLIGYNCELSYLYTSHKDINEEE
ncbi:CRISPR-associated protein Csd1 [Kineothrix alysoides]|uniref:CRISPR-associated protein Csd1 n=2 Tax=Kineothrix alysoides TaxID=1469948 RepID=A0A4R1QXL6_9FIRM|nr:CRISPR-associated protein Csd1 [Kineothrix alysoides]